MTHSACSTAEDYSNHRHAKIVARASAVLCIVVLSYGYWRAWTSDQIHTEELLRMTEVQHAEQTILENLQFGRVVVNDKGIIVSANAAFKKWTHWPDCVGEQIYNVMPEPIRTVHITGFNLAVARAKWSDIPVKPKLIDCRLPRIDDPTKVTHVTIAVSVIKPKDDESRPFVVAYLFKTKSLQKVGVK